MGLLTNAIAEKRSGETGLTGFGSPAEWLVRAFGGGSTAAGTVVNQNNAMSLTAVYAAVKTIAWTMASLPLHVYKSEGRGKSRAANDDVYKILHDSPNSEQTSFQWRSFMFVMQNLYGAGVSEIERNAAGEVVALWPIPTWCITPKRRLVDKQLYFEVTNRLDGQVKILFPQEVLVFPAIGSSLDNWSSPITQHRETLGAAMAVKEFGAKTFGQGVNPAGILSGLKFPKETSEKSFAEKMKENYAGLTNSHRLMLLEEGTKFERIGLPPEDAQYLETRRFDIAEIARIYSVPLYLLQEVSGSTSWGSGIEEMNIGFVTYTLRPYAVLWEQELKKKLLWDDGMFAEFLFEGLLRGKLSERVESYVKLWGIGNMSANDINEVENRNGIGPQGDIYYVPLNVVDAKQPRKEPIKPEKPLLGDEPVDDGKTTEGE